MKERLIDFTDPDEDLQLRIKAGIKAMESHLNKIKSDPAEDQKSIRVKSKKDLWNMLTWTGRTLKHPQSTAWEKANAAVAAVSILGDIKKIVGSQNGKKEEKGGE